MPLTSYHKHVFAMIKSYSLKHKIRGEGRERGPCCVCLGPRSGTVATWVQSHPLAERGCVLGLHLRPLIMKSIPCLGPSVAHAPPLLPAVSPQSPGDTVALLPLLSSAVPQPWAGGVCAASFRVCVWPLSVRGSVWSICLSLDTLHGVAVLCSIKLSYT